MVHSYVVYMFDAGFQGKGSGFDSQGGSNFVFLKLAFSGVVQAGELSGSAMWYLYESHSNSSPLSLSTHTFISLTKLIKINS